MFFFYVFAVFVFCASTNQTPENQTLPWHRNDFIAKQTLDLTWGILLRVVFGFRRLRPSQANLSSMNNVYISPGFNLLPVFRRSLIFLLGLWRRVRGSADPRCVSYRFKLVLYALHHLLWIFTNEAAVSKNSAVADRDSFCTGWGNTWADDGNEKRVWYQTRTSRMRSGPCGGPRRSRPGRRGSITDRQPAFDKRTISKLGKTHKYTGVNLTCNVPRQKVNFPACKLPTASPYLPLHHLRRTIGSAVAWWLPLFKWKCRSPLFCQVPPKQCTNYSLQGMEE